MRQKFTSAAAALLVVACVAIGTASAATAQVPTEADLETEVWAPSAIVPGQPATGAAYVRTESVAATGVELVVRIPAPVEVTVIDGGCTAQADASGTELTCAVGTVDPGSTFGVSFGLAFPSTGTYTVSADALADQADPDGAASAVDVTVVDEESDLYGENSELTALVGQSTRVNHMFFSAGPTGAGDAQISGTFPPGATVVPDSFWFGWGEDRSDTDCVVTATTFTCGPVGGNPGDILYTWLFYNVVLPSPGQYDATATITGRNDPDPSDNTSTVRLQARAPAAELYATLDIYQTWIGQQTSDVAVNAVNLGELSAEDVEATLAVPAGWTVGLPADADPPGRSCSVAPDERSVTCTFDQLEPGALSYLAPVTSPATPTVPGEATVTLATSSPEHGDLPNSASAPLVHATPSVTVTPSTALDDGQQVTLQVSGYPPSTFLGSAQCTATPVGLQDCDADTIRLAVADASGNATLTRSVSRYIVTASDGVVDCAVEACYVGVATQNLTLGTSAPISFSGNPPVSSGLGIELGSPAFVSGDPTGPVTVPATLTCASAATVNVEFVVDQGASGRGFAASTITVPCTPGTEVAISSDLTGSSFEPGTAQVLVRASAGSAFAAAAGDLDVESPAAMLATLLARLADPNDTTVLTEFYAALSFRLKYNPRFARTFWRALLAPAV